MIAYLRIVVDFLVAVKTRSKAILSMTLILSISFLYQCHTNAPDKELHLIPSEFRGVVKIVFQNEGKRKVEIADGVRIYRIPINGKLAFMSKENAGGFMKGDLQFQLIDEEGKITKQLPWTSSFMAHKGRYSEANGFHSDSIVVFSYGFVTCNMTDCPECMCTGYIVDTLKNIPKYIH